MTESFEGQFGTSETPAETIDRMISRFKEPTFLEPGDESHKIRTDIQGELRKTPTDALQELFNEISKRPNIGGWGSGWYTGEVYREIKDELDRRDDYTNWNNRNTMGEKEIELDGGIKAVVVKDGKGYEKEKWSVRTPQRGLRMSKGKTAGEAIANANSTINRVGIERIKGMLADQDY